ncbi:hypothetical protein DFH07DRAFT_804519 [Mycena maculata]|uniref:Protein YOP1 n=1 Tax=Mycena maculata TaxID=230809 RepID=A0AAD7NQQ4_9AGAR|nr:hypothetical protein DFH07DRAFT_804519 [Mycena maculata]
MPLVVPILRLVMVLLNIYETFKVLKPPRLSRRNSGEPTIRALSHRKRSMKGCLAVWIVWCCFMIYERMGEAIVSLFIPFYDEFKSLVLLFLILTRARGAEPIYLHVIRPLLKPYTSTLDAIFDIARMFGDIVFLLSTYPIHFVSTWWHDMFNRPESLVEEQATGGLYTEVQQALYSISYQTPIHQGGRRRSSGPIRGDAHAANNVVAERDAVPRPLVATGRVDRVEPPFQGQVHQIWHPPRSSYQEEDDDDPVHDLRPDLESEETRREREQMEEWRQYPPFPSAYPPTPMPASSSRVPLPTVHDVPAFVPRNFSPIPEDQQPEQGFGQPLPSPHELSNPGSVGSASDDDNSLGIQTGLSRATAFQDDTMDEDEEEEDFDVTLRTPGQLAESHTPMTRSRYKESAATSSTTLNRPVVLPSLLFRISSDTSSVSSESSTTSLVGRKRSREFLVPEHAPKSAVPLALDTRISASSISVALGGIEDESSVASSTSEEDSEEEKVEEDTSGEPPSPLTKRRRVVSPPSRVQPRRTTRTTSQEPPVALPPQAQRRPRQRQPQPKKSQVSEAPPVARTSSRLVVGGPPEPAPRRRTADSDGPAATSRVARSSRRGSKKNS